MSDVSFKILFVRFISGDQQKLDFQTEYSNAAEQGTSLRRTPLLCCVTFFKRVHL